MNAEAVARALDGAQCSGDGWKARCPCHDDDTPSLSVSDGKNGRVLVHCHAGCSQSDVIAALVALGLWPNGTRPKRSTMKTPIIPVPADAPPMSFKHPKYGAPSRVWPYHLADGELAGYVARFDFVKDGKPRKDCLPITFCDLGNGDRGWRSKGIPVPRPLYRLPELLARPGCADTRDRGREGGRRRATTLPRLRRNHADARREVAGEDGLDAGQGPIGDHLAGPRSAGRRLRSVGRRTRRRGWRNDGQHRGCAGRVP